MTSHPQTASSPSTLLASMPPGAPLQRSEAWPGSSPQHHAHPPGADPAAFGMPAERHAQQAAQRAFVALKLSFQYVVDSLPAQAELQLRVRQAETPHELWALRGSVFAALTGNDPQHRSRRQLLNRSLDSMFVGAAPQFN